MPKCGEESTYVHLAMSVDPRSDDLRGLPAQAARQWIVENSEPDELGAVPIPEGRRGDLFTHVTYRTDCNRDEDCDCANDDSVMWTLKEYSTDPSIIRKLEEQSDNDGQTAVGNT
jgi:hypothetical protein